MTDSHRNVILTTAQRKVVADLLPELADRLKLEERSPRTIPLTAEELTIVIEKARAASLVARNGMLRNSLRHVIDVATKTLDEAQGIGSIPASVRLYQFKITLLGTQPPIWRRIQVRDCTLEKLHERIQTAMGWTNYHLYKFEIDGERYGDPELLNEPFDDDVYSDSTVTKISEIVPRNGERFRFIYEYDFGDCWRHEVLFEGCLTAKKGSRYPLCVEGERKCPPEDVGGVRGYAEFLEIIANPRHEQHADFLEWAGEFDPETFDAAQTTKKMRRGFPNWR